jgi:hypothetical protein
VRLATGVHLELELRVLFRDPRQERAELGLVFAGDQGQHIARLGEQTVDDRGRDGVEARPTGYRLVAYDAEVGASLDLEAVHADGS